MKTKTTFLVFFITVLVIKTFAQVPSPALVGYWHNWNDGSAPYIELDQVDARYNVITVAFALPQSGTDYLMTFTPDGVGQSTFIAQIQTVQAQGRKVIISIGGATALISLDNVTERDEFISSMTTIINTYGFDGIDIDLEGTSVMVSGGTLENPVDEKIINLIDAIKQIMANYRGVYGEKLLLTMAPETAFIQGGMSAYGNIWGAYLPVVHALKDSLDLLHVQLYNSGSMYGIDGGEYFQGTADFIVAMTESVIHGFNTAGGMFSGLPPNKIAVGLPACPSAAGGGFTDTATVAAAMQYLLGNGPQPGLYTLVQPNGYPTLGGMMTWSINWDKVVGCNNSAYQFAENYERIFGDITTISEVASASFKIYPNPTSDYLNFDGNVFGQYRIKNLLGQIVDEGEIQSPINIKFLKKGIYVIETQLGSTLLMKE